jgi:hypothetical protein
MRLGSPHTDKRWQPYLPGSWVLGRQASFVWLPVCAATGLAVWPQPQRRLGRLHRLLAVGEQLDGECVEVDLLAQAGGECLHSAGGVVAVAEAPVDHVCTRGA